jgi:hypothetical protein
VLLSSEPKQLTLQSRLSGAQLKWLKTWRIFAIWWKNAVRQVSIERINIMISVNVTLSPLGESVRLDEIKLA